MTKWGNSGVSPEQSQEWLTYLNSKKISWMNWNLSDKTESSAASAPGAGKTGGWSQSEKFEEKHSSLTLN
ncbi:hypothetical protein [Bacillus atrophaeus]|uniref:hypothetical protein n=1 Tax=Bacillus atrophaeus TaxID=1452 RepID=UPI0035A8AB87